MSRKPYPSDISEEEWHFVAPYLTLMDANAPQRRHDLREVFNALRWLARAGAPWLLLPHDLPPWHKRVYQPFRRWDEAGCFEAMVNDMRSIIRVSEGRRGQPSAVVLDGRTLQSSCESGVCAGYDGYKRRRGSKVHMAVDTLGQLIAMTVKLAWADQGYTGEQARQDAQASEIDLQIVKLPEAKKGFVLLPRRWVVERLPQVLASLHFVVFAILMPPKAAAVMAAAGSS